MPNRKSIDDAIITYLYESWFAPRWLKNCCYWSKEVLTLALRQKLRCPYCDQFLLDSYERGYYGCQIEHVLPKSKYPFLENVLSNKALACTICNSHKGAYDPNKEGPPIYDRERDGDALSDAQRAELITRCRPRVRDGRAHGERIFTEQSVFLRENLPWLFPDEIE